ncbi:MAG: hypothetical protein AAF202_03780, partial [Pseudomonadota bacterium]
MSPNPGPNAKATLLRKSSRILWLRTFSKYHLILCMSGVQSENLKVAVIGASRGLGLALTKLLQKDPRVGVIKAISRKPHQSADLTKVQPFVYDLSSEDLSPLCTELELFQPDKIIYCAGGGPFSRFEDAKWSAHSWAFHVTFLSAAKLAHWYMARAEASAAHQFIMVGSSIAESQGDANASSYAA